MPAPLPAATFSRRWLPGALLLLVTLATYQPALDGRFIWDDDAHVTAPPLRTATGLWKIWTDPKATQQYYPLTHTAFWLEYHVWGDNPIGYHVVNVVLHVTAALLVWRVLDRLAVPGAFLAAAIFALHPVHVESVAWITELKNTLSAVFYLAALLVYLRFDPPGVPRPVKKRLPPVDARDWHRYWIALGLFVCALLTKTVTASLPAAILLIVWWKEGRVDWRRRIVPLIPFFVLGGALGLTTAWVERHLIGAEGEAFAFTWTDRVLIAGRALWFYARTLVWPVNLIFFYPRWVIDRSAWWQYLYPAAALGVLVALVALRRRLGRAPLAGALFFVGTLVPALGFFNVYPFVYSFVADHFQYPASLGLIAVAAALIVTTLTRVGVWGKPLGHAVALALLLVLAVLSWRQAHLYTDLETLYRDVIARNPGASLAYLNLGGLYGQQARHAEAIELFRALIALRPDYAAGYRNLGTVYAIQRRYPEAIALYQKALAIKPDLATAHYHLGLVYAAQGRTAEAITAYKMALAAQPDLVWAYRSLAAIDIDRGQYREAVAALKAAIAIKPDLAEAHYALGVAFTALGQPAEAVAAYRAAISVNRDYIDAYNNLGLLYRKQGQLPEAIAAYRSAITIKPDFAAAFNNLGAAYFAQGNYADSIVAWQNAVRLDPSGATGQAAQANIEIARARLGR